MAADKKPIEKRSLYLWESVFSCEFVSDELLVVSTIPYCLFPIAYCLLPIAHCLLPIAHCLLPIAHCLLPIHY